MGVYDQVMEGPQVLVKCRITKQEMPKENCVNMDGIWVSKDYAQGILDSLGDVHAECESLISDFARVMDDETEQLPTDLGKRFHSMNFEVGCIRDFIDRLAKEMAKP